MKDTSMAASKDKKNDLKNIPVWDLNDFYKGLDDPQIKKDLDQALQDAQNFETKFSKTFKSFENAGPALFDAITAYEKIHEKIGYFLSYAYLKFTVESTNESVAQFLQMAQEKAADIRKHLLFFTLDLNKLPDEVINKALAQDPRLKKYAFWLESLRKARPYVLSEELEKLLLEKELTSSQSWIRLYDETSGSLVFHFKGKKATLTDMFDYMKSADGNIRREAALELSRGLTEQKRIFALVTNTLAKDKQIEDQLRGFKHPVQSRNLANLIEDPVVDALVDTVKKHYPKLSHRFYKIKAKLLGKEKLEYWDCNAPLGSEATISWEEAKEIIFKAYGNFSNIMEKEAKKFFDNSWIHAQPLEGKRSGAYSHPTTPNVHPYVFMNYKSKQRDVMTLAHELGHGVHQSLASHHGYLLSDTPLTIAETASIFGEMLTFQELLKRCKTPKEKVALLCEKIGDMLSTVVRQIAFFEFERRVHTMRKEKELSVQDLNTIWKEALSESLGPWVNMDEKVHIYWSYVPHFIHSPFYVYSYAFGDCLVNSLYGLYKDNYPNFENLYIDLLKAGGSKSYTDLLKPFQLDPKDPTFWEKGLKVIEDMIDELEKLSSTN